MNISVDWLLTRSGSEFESRSVSLVPRPERVRGAGGIPDLRGRTILVAEDTRDQRSFVEALLEPTGANILTARDGHEALALCESDAPDLLLLDIDLPGLHGDGVARRLRLASGAVPTIALTGYAGAKDAGIGLTAGADAYLTKPFLIDKLYALLLRFLDARDRQ